VCIASACRPAAA